MSTVKVNTVDKRTGSTLTLGGCGTTVTLGAGATQSGFGRTGTVDWCTTAKTSPFTGVSGTGYFVNTTCGAVTVTLPASPSAGDIISVKDYAYSFATNNLTVCNNGSNIGGQAGCIPLKYDTNGTSKTFVYADATKGWLVVNESTDTSTKNSAPAFIVATGGTETTCGDYKIHTFTSDGTFTICTAPTPANNNVDYLVVAGGAGGGRDYGGGGGAGGYRESHTVPVSGCYTASPLASATSLPISIQAYPITVGGGGAGSTLPCTKGASGSNSIFSTITSAGGGGAGSNATKPGLSGGSGGGGSSFCSAIGGSGNTPPTSPPQGNNGGNGIGSLPYSGGGGGAIEAGNTDGQSAGGDGTSSSINGTPTARAGGGAAGNPASQPGGTGGGGNKDTPGTINTGGGGGGGDSNVSGGSGGSGVVIIRYKFQ